VVEETCSPMRESVAAREGRGGQSQSRHVARGAKVSRGWWCISLGLVVGRGRGIPRQGIRERETRRVSEINGTSCKRQTDEREREKERDSRNGNPTIRSLGSSRARVENKGRIRRRAAACEIYERRVSHCRHTRGGNTEVSLSLFDTSNEPRPEGESVHQRRRGKTFRLFSKRARSRLARGETGAKPGCSRLLASA